MDTVNPKVIWQDDGQLVGPGKVNMDTVNPKLTWQDDDSWLVLAR
jgi:hypothetical protein